MHESDVAVYLAETCHELRTPVAVLSLVTGIFDRVDEIDQERLHRLAETVERQCVQLRVTIDRYLEHGELLFGGSEAPEITFDADVVVREAVEALVPMIPHHRLAVTLDHVRLRGDPRRLWSIVTNLVVNAARYSEEVPPVEVALTASEGVATLTVADRGHGFPEESREVLLQPFRRGVAEEVQRTQGAGLGLTIVAGHVRALDGSLQIHDRSPRGSVVTVTLPRTDARRGGRAVVALDQESP